MTASSSSTGVLITVHPQMLDVISICQFLLMKNKLVAGRGGDFEEAFGFSLAAMLTRADEFSEAAERVRMDNRALKLMRERITLHRRDIDKLIEAAVEGDVLVTGTASGDVSGLS